VTPTTPRFTGDFGDFSNFSDTNADFSDFSDTNGNIYEKKCSVYCSSDVKNGIELLTLFHKKLIKNYSRVYNT